MKICQLFILINLIYIVKLDDSNKDIKSVHDCLYNTKRCLILCDQNVSGIYIYDIQKSDPIWSFVFSKDGSEKIPKDKIKYFKAISDAKLVYENYIVAVTSGGAVIIIELDSKRILRYFIVKGNLHSVDLAPDGSVFVVASSEDFLAALPGITKYDKNITSDIKFRKIDFPFGHAVVWHIKENKLWVGGNRTLQSFKYNYDTSEPNLKLFEKYYVDDDQVHEFFPILDTDYIWLTTLNFIYVLNHKNGNIIKLFNINDVKSISTNFEYNRRLGKLLSNLENNLDPQFIQNLYKQGGINKLNDSITFYSKNDLNKKIPNEFMEIKKIVKNTIFVSPDEEWWTDKIKLLDTQKPVFIKKGAKIYKARWLILNSFSYDLFYSKKFN